MRDFKYQVLYFKERSYKARKHTWYLALLVFKLLTYAIFDTSTTARDVVVLHGGQGSLKGKTALVTCGNVGLGLETCKALAYAGCRVIMASKSVDLAEKAINEDIRKPGLSNYVVEDTTLIIPKQLDLSDLLSVKVFAEDVIANEDRIDFLILNEGVMASRVKKYTSAGFEKHMGVNHFGPAFLTSLLRSKLESQKFRSRVITLTSSAHSMGYIMLNDLHYKKGRRYSPWNAYANSKLANILFTKKLAEELKDTSVTAVSVHPGIIGFKPSKEIFIEGYFTSFLFDYRKTAPQAATTVVWACLDSSIDSKESRGGYFVDCTMKSPSPICSDVTLINNLWDETNTQIKEATKSLDIDFRIQRKLSISSHVVVHNSNFSEVYENYHPSQRSDEDNKESDSLCDCSDESIHSLSDPDVDYKLRLGLEDCKSDDTEHRKSNIESSREECKEEMVEKEVESTCKHSEKIHYKVHFADNPVSEEIVLESSIELKKKKLMWEDDGVFEVQSL